MKRVALVVALALCTRHASAKPESRSEAKVRFDAAQKEYAAGQFAEAARDFSRAYELVGDAGILYNAAQSYRLAKNWAMAGELYRSLLDKVSAHAANRPEIEGRIAEMDERLADEQRRAERAKELKAAKPAPTPEPKPAPTPEPTPEPKRVVAEHPGRTLEIVGYSLYGVTGAFLATGIAMSVLSKQANDSVQSAASHNGVFTQSLHDDQSRGHTYDKVQIASYAIAGAAAIGASVSLYLGLRADKRANERVSITPGIGPGAFVLTGQF